MSEVGAESLASDIPNGDIPVHGDCCITRGQLFTLVYAFILRHCLSDVAIKDLIAIFNILMPGSLPHNKYFYNKLLFDKVSNNFETHIFCRDCGAYLSMMKNNLNDNLLCSECHGSVKSNELLKCGYSFMVYSIGTQLKTLFESGEVQQYMCRNDVSTNENCGIFDLTDGSEYRKLKICFPESLSLTCNTDGVPVFSSSNVSLWPVYFTINELPLRMRNTHMLLSALWLGSVKPRIDTLFSPILQELEKLSSEGFSWISNGKRS